MIKKLLIILIPILLLGGGVVGLAMAGIIKVPGLTPKKSKPAVAAATAKPKIEEVAPVPVKKKPLEQPKVAKVETDATKGAKKLAQLWNNVPTVRLMELAKSFRDPELANVLVQMDPEKVAELLGLLDAQRSARLSKELQRVASIVTKQSS